MPLKPPAGPTTDMYMLSLGISSPMWRNLFVIEDFDVTSYCYRAFHLPRSFGDRFLKAFKRLSKWVVTRKSRGKYLCRYSIEVKGQITFVSKVRSVSVTAIRYLTESRIR